MKRQRRIKSAGTMRRKMATWILLVLVCISLGYSQAQLRMIQAVFRHGNRTPVKGLPGLYPNDPYRDLTYEPLGLGALTNTGKQTIYKLGEYLRSRYGQFLGQIYSPSLIRFQADEVDRVIMTGQLVAAALFPPVKSQKWNPSLNWQPIPIWMEPMEEDILFLGFSCTNYKKMREELEKENQYLLKRDRENKEIYDYLSYHTGGNITQETSFYLRQQLFAQRDIGLALPEWTKSVFPNGQLEKLSNFDVLIQSYTNEMKQLMGGMWIKQFLKHVKDHLNSTSPRTEKAFMYPAHEYNIGGILTALNSYDYKVPYYGACIVFELHENDGEYFVQVLHKDQNNVRLLQIPGCEGTMCHLEDFIELHKAVIPDDEKEACGKLDVLV